MRRNPLHHIKIGADAFHPSAVLRGLGQAAKFDRRETKFFRKRNL